MKSTKRNVIFEKKNKASFVTTDKNSLYRVLIIFLIIVTAIAFSPVVKNDFLVNWDDDGYIINNPTVHKLNKENLTHIFTEFYMGNYHPLTTLTYAVLFHYYELNPKPYHVLNLFIHILNVLLVYVFIRKLCKKKYVALLSATIFALHPLHVESVAWISELKDVLYTLFFFAAIIFYQIYNENKRYIFYVFSIAVYLLALMSKSAAVVLPLVLLLLDYFSGQKLSFKCILNKLPFFIMAFVFGVIALKSQDATTQHLTPDYSIVQSFFVASYALGFYIFKFFIPIKLSAFYPHTFSANDALPLLYYMSPVLIVAFIFIAYRLVRNLKVLAFGFLFFFFTIMLVLQFFPVGGAVVAERYTYVPYVGLAFIIAIFVFKMFEKHKTKQIFIATILVFFILILSLITYNRNKVWANGITLFDDVIKKHPQAFYAYHSRGIAYYYKGDYKKSLDDYEMATKLNSEYGLTFYNKGLSQMMLQKYEDAVLSFNSTIELIPNHDQAYNDRAIAHYNLNSFEQAISDYGTALKINPKNSRAYYNRGVTYLRMNDLDSACLDWQKASEMGIKEALSLRQKYCK